MLKLCIDAHTKLMINYVNDVTCNGIKLMINYVNDVMMLHYEYTKYFTADGTQIMLMIDVASRISGF